MLSAGARGWEERARDRRSHLVEVQERRREYVARGVSCLGHTARKRRVAEPRVAAGDEREREEAHGAATSAPDAACAARRLKWGLTSMAVTLLYKTHELVVRSSALCQECESCPTAAPTARRGARPLSAVPSASV